MMSPSVDVVVCTYSAGRLSLLEEALDSLAVQSHRPLGIILVVDHNRDLAEKLARTVGEPISVIESTGPKGLSGTRNTGLAQSQAEVVAFIDDDAVADPGWLEGLVKSYSHDGVLAVGGRALPVWEGGRKPRWLPEEFLWVVGCTYRGMPERGRVRNVIGCNMSFRSYIFETLGGFDSSVGRLGTKLLGCEETELCIRASKRWPDREIVYVPEAVVHHHVPKSRQTWSYFVRRCYSEGLSKAIVRRLGGSRSLSVEGHYVTRALAPAVGRHLLRALLLRDVVPSLAQAGAICLGLLVVGIGFGLGTVRSRAGSSSEEGSGV